MAFTGNMSGLLIAEYILDQRKAKGTLPVNGALIKTIVSSNLANAITDYYHVKLIEVLTGFKYIGEQIKQFEETHQYEYLFGYEESYGCLVGTHARDKDAVTAVMMLCEAAAFYKKQGLTLWDQMIRIYEKYGYYREGQISITMKGQDGAEKIKKMMEKLRNTKMEELGGNKVIQSRDYLSGKVKDLITKEESETGLPKSNVLYYLLENDGWCCVRPSGTEPKIKFYMGVKGTSLQDSKEKLDILANAMKKLAQ